MTITEGMIEVTAAETVTTIAIATTETAAMAETETMIDVRHHAREVEDHQFREPSTALSA